MLGIEKRVKHLRDTLVEAFRQKSASIMHPYIQTRPEDVPRLELTRAMILRDVADVLANLSVPEQAKDETA